MKKLGEYLKAFAVPMAVCVALLAAQAACDVFSLLTMRDISQTGIKNSGVISGLPEAVTSNGMSLIRCFMTDEDRELFDGLYNTIEPQSSEAMRYSEKYPLAMRETVCVLREDVTEDGAVQGTQIYNRAANAFLLYMKENDETNELQGISDFYEFVHTEKNDPGTFGANLKSFEDEPESLPDGTIGTITDGMLVTMPEDKTTSTASEPPTESEPDDAEHSEFSLPDTAGSAYMDGLYSYLPVLAILPQDSMNRALAAADESGEAACRDTGITLKVLFYKELGINTDQISTEYIHGAMLRVLWLWLLGAAAAVAAELICNRTARLAGGADRNIRLCIAVGIRAVLYGAAMTVCGLVFAAKGGLLHGVFAVLTAVAAVAAILAVLAVNYSPLGVIADGLHKALDEKLCRHYNTASGMAIRLATAIGPAVIMLAVNMLTAPAVSAVGTAESVSCFAQLVLAMLIAAAGAGILNRARD